eukprot:m.346107 g.346107  ORF g.346107 m.346107 type:complete len:270 (+) comp28142_c0_seq1:164-973(+)
MVTLCVSRLFLLIACASSSILGQDHTRHGYLWMPTSVDPAQVDNRSEYLITHLGSWDTLAYTRAFVTDDVIKEWSNATAEVNMRCQAAGWRLAPMLEVDCGVVLGLNSSQRSFVVDKLVKMASVAGYVGYTLDMECGSSHPTQMADFLNFFYQELVVGLGRAELSFFQHSDWKPWLVNYTGKGYVFDMDTYDGPYPQRIEVWAKTFFQRAGIGLETFSKYYGEPEAIDWVFNNLRKWNVSAFGTWGDVDPIHRNDTAVWFQEMKTFLGN